MSKKTYTPSGFHAQSFDPKRLRLLLDHLTHAYDTRGNKVQGWAGKCLSRIHANLTEDDSRNVSPRIVNRFQRASVLNGEAGYAPRGTAALVKDLTAC